MMQCELHQVRVRRDAQTTTPTTITAYELPILQVLYGIENMAEISILMDERFIRGCAWTGERTNQGRHRSKLI